MTLPGSPWLPDGLQSALKHSGCVGSGGHTPEDRSSANRPNNPTGIKPPSAKPSNRPWRFAGLEWMLPAQPGIILFAGASGSNISPWCGTASKPSSPSSPG